MFFSINNRHKRHEVRNAYYQNVRGLNTKADVLHDNLLTSHYDILFLTETWLKEDAINKDFFPPSFQVFRRDRDTGATGKTRGGGVVLALSDEFECRRLTEFETSNEDVWVEVKSKSTKFLAGCVYFPPNSPVCDHMEFFDTVSNCYMASDCDDILLCGDFK